MMNFSILTFIILLRGYRMHQGNTGTLTSHLGVFDGLTTSHEIGHILGAQHGNKPNILFFARGYQTKSGK